MSSREELMEALGDDLCDYCPWKNDEVPRRCDSVCEGNWCDEALDAFLDDNEQFFDE